MNVVLLKLLSVASTAIFAFAQIGAGSASLAGSHEPQVPEKLRIND